MAEFKDSVPHTGGKLTIHKRGNAYSLGYSHGNRNRMAVVQLMAVRGQAVAIVPVTGMNQNPDPEPPQLLTMMPTDAEGLFGRRCPKCDSYFRTGHVVTTFCPYCDAETSWRDFMTADQREFIRRQHDAILAALAGPDADTTVDFDAQLAELTRKDGWIYSEERQQTHFKCSNPKCKMESDVLGEYVRCPNCGTRTARNVFTRKLAEVSSDFEKDDQDIPKESRDQRQRRWRHYVPTMVSEFEALGRDVSAALAFIPATPRRRKAIAELSFQHPLSAARHLSEWVGIDFMEGVKDEDRAFVDRMFNRRHLFVHAGGKVDQEYLDKTGDTSVRLNEVVRVGSKEVRRLISLVEKMASNLLEGFDSIS